MVLAPFGESLSSVVLLAQNGDYLSRCPGRLRLITAFRLVQFVVGVANKGNVFDSLWDHSIKAGTWYERLNAPVCRVLYLGPMLFQCIGTGIIENPQKQVLGLADFSTLFGCPYRLQIPHAYCPVDLGVLLM
jgi:hypothetical protein